MRRQKRTFLHHLLHLLPRIRNLPGVIDISRSVWERWEGRIVSVRVERDRPVDEIHYWKYQYLIGKWNHCGDGEEAPTDSQDNPRPNH